MRGCLRLLAVFLAAALAGSPARATSVYEYAKGEYVLIDSGMAPNGHLSLAAHGEGEFGSENFYVYLMAEPAHRRIAALAASRIIWIPDPPPSVPRGLRIRATWRSRTASSAM
jgi:hypothetical protein